MKFNFFTKLYRKIGGKGKNIKKVKPPLIPPRSSSLPDGFFVDLLLKKQKKADQKFIPLVPPQRSSSYKGRAEIKNFLDL